MTRSSTVLQYVHSFWVHDVQLSTRCPPSIPPDGQECEKQVSKIEMYKKSMNNNYRKSILTVCLLMKNKTSLSVWSCVSPFVHPYIRCTLTLVCTHLRKKPMCGSSHHSVWFDGHFKKWYLGNKLWVKFYRWHLRQHFLKMACLYCNSYKWDESVSSAFIL